MPVIAIAPCCCYSITPVLRAAEVLGLDLSGVDLTAGQLRVTGKGNKQRIVPFGAELRDAIADYLPMREAYLRGFSVDESALFFECAR